MAPHGGLWRPRPFPTTDRARVFLESPRWIVAYGGEIQVSPSPLPGHLEKLKHGRAKSLRGAVGRSMHSRERRAEATIRRVRRKMPRARASFSKSRRRPLAKPSPQRAGAIGTREFPKRETPRNPDTPSLEDVPPPIGRRDAKTHPRTISQRTIRRMSHSPIQHLPPRTDLV